ASQPGVESRGSGAALLLDMLKPADIEHVRQCLQTAGADLRDLQLPGAPAAAVEALQQLRQQQQELLAALQGAHRDVCGLLALEAAERLAPNYTSSSSGGQTAAARAAAAAKRPQLDRVAFLGELPRQLEQFGVAVCCQLPIAWWCCNPACKQLQGVSEQALVAGRGCVCAGCRTARFCSRACLEQCWKHQHRRVCKRIAAAQQA
ncbi:hypothetical protein COO60DRAFT_1469746, partial [Scenedesmus sp. NREL 46B-D3]